MRRSKSRLSRDRTEQVTYEQNWTGCITDIIYISSTIDFNCEIDSRGHVVLVCVQYRDLRSMGAKINVMCCAITINAALKSSCPGLN